jgi:hypothetical protein
MGVTSFLFFCTFGITVLWFLMSYDNPDNVQFVILLVAFTSFLWYLSSYKALDMHTKREHFVVEKEEVTPPSGSLRKWIALPTTIKNVLTLEIDQMLSIYAGMPDPDGKTPDDVYFDETVVKKIKDDSLMTGDDVDKDKLKKTQDEYYSIDKLFRDLRINEPAMYLKTVFIPGKQAAAAAAAEAEAEIKP